MAQVAADVEHLKALKRDIAKATEEINAALSKVERSLNRAAWRDSTRQKFEDEFKVAKNSASRIVNTNFDSLSRILTTKIADLEKYLK